MVKIVLTLCAKMDHQNVSSKCDDQKQCLAAQSPESQSLVGRPES